MALEGCGRLGAVQSPKYLSSSGTISATVVSPTTSTVAVSGRTNLIEITGSDGQSIAADSSQKMEPLRIGAGQTVTQKINIASLYPIQDFGTYHVRAHVYFSDLGRYFYSQTKVVEVTDARPIWKRR